MERLKDKVAIITGAAQGIGKATAEVFAAEGAKVAVWDLDTEKGQAVASSINGRFYQVNTAKMEDVEKAAKAVVDDFGQIDVLVNNAGITRDSTLKKMTSEQWQQVIDVNLTGVFNCCRVIQAYMVERGYGRIINASSTVAHYGNFGQTNYAATKAGLIGMTKTMAKELGSKGITVNAVAPGFIATEMVGAIPQNIIDGIVSKTPVRRMGTPEEIGRAYLYLASDEASFVTGSVLTIDGGITL